MPYIGNPIYQSAFVVDQFSGNGSTTAFTMSVAPAGVTNVLVAVSGVLQDPSTYGVVGNTITFSAAPPSGTGNISCRYLGVPASGVTTTAYRTVTEFTATASQTTFTPPSYTVGFINVYLNGVLLGSADYTATNGTTVVLATGASAGNLLTVESFLVSSVLNAIPNTAGSVSSSNIANDVTINFADGSASTPSITNNGDTNTGIFFPAADSIGFAEGGAEIARFDSSGNLGIGTTSPIAKLDVRGSGAYFYDNSTTDFQLTVGSSISTIGTTTATPLAFKTNVTERMRIDSSGRVTTPYQPSFDAYGTVGNLAVTTEIPIPLPTTTFNVGSNYNTSTYRFTAQVAGIYFFRAQVYKQSSGNASRLRLYKNAADVRVYQYIDPTGTFTFGITGIISLAVGDYVTCNFGSDGGGTSIYLADNPGMS